MTFDKWLMEKHQKTITDLFHLPDEEIEKYEVEYKADIKRGCFLIKEGTKV